MSRPKQYITRKKLKKIEKKYKQRNLCTEIGSSLSDVNSWVLLTAKPKNQIFKQTRMAKIDVKNLVFKIGDIKKMTIINNIIIEDASFLT